MKTERLCAILVASLVVLPSASVSAFSKSTAFLFAGQLKREEIIACSRISTETAVTSDDSANFDVAATIELAEEPRALVHDLQAELNDEDLGLCHGILHASGVRQLADLQALTDGDIWNMGADLLDSRNMLRVRDDLFGINGNAKKNFQPTLQLLANELSTVTDGAFNRIETEQFAIMEDLNFQFEAISLENDVYKGRLFTVEQCEQINRMAEYHAYSKLETIGGGWTNSMYTLTAQHIQCKEIADMIPTTKTIFRQLFRELYSLFPDRIRPGSILFESDGEPHLVKYNGRVKGTEPHTDNSEHIYITVNVALSAEDEYTGGGTHITKLNKTISLQQGEMLIHLGDLEHSGAEITSGVRRILIAFLACEWEEDSLNKEKLENARDYVPPSTD